MKESIFYVMKRDEYSRVKAIEALSFAERESEDYSVFCERIYYSTGKPVDYYDQEITIVKDCEDGYRQDIVDVLNNAGIKARIIKKDMVVLKLPSKVRDKRLKDLYIGLKKKYFLKTPEKISFALDNLLYEIRYDDIMIVDISDNSASDEIWPRRVSTDKLDTDYYLIGVQQFHY